MEKRSSRDTEAQRRAKRQRAIEERLTKEYGRHRADTGKRQRKHIEKRQRKAIAIHIADTENRRCMYREKEEIEERHREQTQ